MQRPASQSFWCSSDFEGNCRGRIERHTAYLHFVYISGMASEDTTAVRVRRPDSERLQALAKRRQTTVIEVLHSAIDALEGQESLREINQDYQRLRDDPELWQRYLAERQEWDTLA